MRRAALCLIAFVPFGPPLAAQTGPAVALAGFCEASAAVLLPDGRLAVASDDREHLATFRDGVPVDAEALHLGDITDVEAAATFGAVTLWLTSHSTNTDLEDKKKRKVLVATTVAADGRLALDGAPYRGLRDLLAGPLAAAGHPRDVSTEPGWNDLEIQGLAALPDGTALIGLRRPQIGGKAVVLPVTGLVEAARSGTAPQVGAALLVDLYGLGIRGMDTLPDGRVILLAGLGGDIPDGKEDSFPYPQVFVWDGVSATASKMADLPPRMVGEAVVALPSGRIAVMGDNGGTILPSGKECDDKAYPQEGAAFPVVETAVP